MRVKYDDNLSIRTVEKRKQIEMNENEKLCSGVSHIT